MSLLSTLLVGEVGYRVGMDGSSSASTRLTFVTAGWLLMRLAHAPDALSRYSHVVLDEVHERDMVPESAARAGCRPGWLAGWPPRRPVAAVLHIVRESNDISC